MAPDERFSTAATVGSPNRNGFLSYAIEYQLWLNFYRATDKTALSQELSTLPTPQSPRYAALKRVLREESFSK